MTLYGWIYLVFSIIFAMSQIYGIDRPRKPLTRETVIGGIIGQALGFWALYAWGIRG